MVTSGQKCELILCEKSVKIGKIGKIGKHYESWWALVRIVKFFVKIGRTCWKLWKLMKVIRIGESRWKLVQSAKIMEPGESWWKLVIDKVDEKWWVIFIRPSWRPSQLSRLYVGLQKYTGLSKHLRISSLLRCWRI